MTQIGAGLRSTQSRNRHFLACILPRAGVAGARRSPREPTSVCAGPAVENVHGRPHRACSGGSPVPATRSTHCEAGPLSNEGPTCASAGSSRELPMTPAQDGASTANVRAFEVAVLRGLLCHCTAEPLRARVLVIRPFVLPPPAESLSRGCTRTHTLSHQSRNSVSAPFTEPMAAICERRSSTQDRWAVW
jgi:hypothetical protein